MNEKLATKATEAPLPEQQDAAELQAAANLVLHGGYLGTMAGAVGQYVRANTTIPATQTSFSNLV